jgi:prefoldin alpha subunit
MSAPPKELTEQQVREDLMRLEAYRSQLTALAQQHAILGNSRQEHERARDSLDGIDRTEPPAEFLVPLGGEAYVRTTIPRTGAVLIGIGSGVAVEMDRAKASELLAQRIGRIDEAVRELEGQLRSINERAEMLSRRLESAARPSGAPDGVGGD